MSPQEGQFYCIGKILGKLIAGRPSARQAGFVSGERNQTGQP
jgi:hypothetical protein